MIGNPKLTTYYVRATASASAEQVAFECEGSAMAHAKAAELRMSGYRDVVMSLRAEPSQVAELIQPITPRQMLDGNF